MLLLVRIDFAHVGILHFNQEIFALAVEIMFVIIVVKRVTCITIVEKNLTRGFRFRTMADKIMGCVNGVVKTVTSGIPIRETK